MSASLFFITGEPSGDGHAARLLEALRERLPDVRSQGCGGPSLRAAGCDTLWDIRGWSAIGLAQALRLVPRLKRTGRAIARHLADQPPDILILVDFGAFNVRLARMVRSLAFPIAYYIPPGSWRRGPAGPELAQLTDLILTPFRWSEEALRAVGANAHFVGHPVLDAPPARYDRAAFCEAAGLDPGAPILGLLPGSRRQELAAHIPLLTQAARLVTKRIPNVQFAAAAAPSIGAEHLARALAAGRPPGGHDSSLSSHKPTHPHTHALTPPTSAALAGRPLAVTNDDARSCFAAADALLCCSGTATLEAAVAGTPLCVFYRSSPILTLEGLLRGLKFVGLPNLLAGRPICREILASGATPEALAAEAVALLTDETTVARMRNDLADVRSLLGAPGASRRAADLIVRHLGCA